MLAKRTIKPSVFSGAIALATISGCSLQDYDYLGAGPANSGANETSDESTNRTSDSTSSSSEDETSTVIDTSAPDASSSEEPSSSDGTETTASSTAGPSTSVPEESSSTAASDSSDTTSDITSEPVPPLVTPGNLFANSSFESGSAPWVVLGNAVLQSSKNAAHTGERSLLCQGRTQAWEGPSVDLLPLVEAGETYIISAWLRSGSGDAIGFRMGTKELCPGADESDQNNYHNQGSSFYDGGREWAYIEATYTVPTTCDLDVLVLYFEGPGANESFYVDDVALVHQPKDETTDSTQTAADAGAN